MVKHIDVMRNWEVRSRILELDSQEEINDVHECCKQFQMNLIHKKKLCK